MRLAEQQNMRPFGSRSRDQRSEEHTSELQSRFDLVCRLLLEKKKHRERLQLSTKFVYVLDSGRCEQVEGVAPARRDVGFIRAALGRILRHLRTEPVDR